MQRLFKGFVTVLKAELLFWLLILGVAGLVNLVQVIT
jgi:hypothetical protein